MAHVTSGPGVDALRFEKCIDVSGVARRYFPTGRVLIDQRVHDSLVSWPSSSMRQHGILIDEYVRLEHLLKSASQAGQGGVFYCRAQDAQAMLLHRIIEFTQPVWLIERA
jgi:hypothetical protein